MSFTVALLDETGFDRLTPERATTLCAAAFTARNLDLERVGEVSVAVVSLSTIGDLNLKYRGIEAPTDVLSFEIDGPYGEMAGEVLVAPEFVRGDLPAVEELVVHGALHLAGMEHGDDFEASEMASVQRRVLEETAGSGG